jgi:8-oxo-dGTP pyrophosphatase MutT (NUDIX family)
VKDVPESWPVLEVEDVWSGPAPFSVRRDIISAPAHPEVTFGRLVIEHPGAAIVLAVDEHEQALVVEQYRHPAQMRFVELPAGLLDVPGENPLVAAKRELLEEAAHTADEWAHLLTTYPTPGLSAERHDFYVARGLHHVPDRGGFELHHEEADMTLHWVPVDELLMGVLDGRLTDGPLAQAVMSYRMRGY